MLTKRERASKIFLLLLYLLLFLLSVLEEKALPICLGMWLQLIFTFKRRLKARWLWAMGYIYIVPICGGSVVYFFPWKVCEDEQKGVATEMQNWIHVFCACFCPQRPGPNAFICYGIYIQWCLFCSLQVFLLCLLEFLFNRFPLFVVWTFGYRQMFLFHTAEQEEQDKQ